MSEPEINLWLAVLERTVGDLHKRCPFRENALWTIANPEASGVKDICLSIGLSVEDVLDFADKYIDGEKRFAPTKRYVHRYTPPKQCRKSEERARLIVKKHFNRNGIIDANMLRTVPLAMRKKVSEVRKQIIKEIYFGFNINRPSKYNKAKHEYVGKLIGIKKNSVCFIRQKIRKELGK